MKYIITTILLIGTISSAFSKNEDLDLLKQNIEHWINLKKEISVVQNEWTTDKAIIERELSIAEIEKKELTKELKTVSKQQEDIGKNIESLISQKSDLETAVNGLRPVLDKAEKNILLFKTYIPKPLYPSVKKDFDNIANVKNKNDIIDRLRQLVSLYLKIETMEHETHVVREIFTISNGSKVEMQVLYIGLGQAFAVSSDGQNAQIGKPSQTGWQWTDKSDIAPEIQNAMLVYSREVSPEIVNLPISVKGESK
jgi:hypothetical protein